MAGNNVRVIYAANTKQGRVFLGFSDASFCTVSVEELRCAGVFQADLDAIGFVPKMPVEPSASPKNTTLSAA